MSKHRFNQGVVLAGCLALVAAGRGLTATPEEFKFGCILSLTGPDAARGQATRMALEDHVQALNARGGIKGRKVRLVVTDDKTSWNEATACGARLMEQERVAGIIGPAGSYGAFRLASLCASARVPVIATTAPYSGVTGDVPGAPRPFLFRTCTLLPAQAAILADYAFRELGKREAGILYDHENWGGEFANSFETAFSRLGGKVVASAYFTMDAATDFKTQFTRIAAAKPDCLVIPLASSQQMVLMTAQARALGLGCPILGGDTWAAGDLLAQGGKELEGTVFTTGLSTADPRFADFNARFRQAHGSGCDIAAYYALDAAMALEHAIKVSLEKTGKITPAYLEGALANMKGVPVFTGKMTMDPRTHNPRNLPMLVVTVKDGRQQVVKSYP